MQVVDLSEAPALRSAEPEGVVIAVGDLGAPNAEYWLQQATFTLTEERSEDRRAVTVPDVRGTVERLEQRCATWPVAAAIGDDVLRAVDPVAPAYPGVVAE